MAPCNKCYTFLHHNPVSVDWLYCMQASGPTFGSVTPGAWQGLNGGWEWVVCWEVLDPEPPGGPHHAAGHGCPGRACAWNEEGLSLGKSSLQKPAELPAVRPGLCCAPVGFRILFLGHDCGWPLTPAAVEGETLQRLGPSDALAPFPLRALNLPTVGLALGPAIKQSCVGV